MMSMSSGDDGWRKITRNGGWDTDNGILSCGAYVFGDPEGDRKFSFLFTGHHLTMRCDGNSGGPGDLCLRWLVLRAAGRGRLPG